VTHFGHRNRKDANQNPIVAALKAAGVTVRDLSNAGGGVTDLLTLFKGVIRVVEIKNPKRSWTYTPMQEKFRKVWPVITVETAEDALRAHGIEVAT
jgi:hypothetical protein